MSTPTPTIHTAHAEQILAAAAVAAEALAPLAVATWLVPDPHQRHPILRDVLHITLIHAHTHGVVHVTSDLSAVAAWLDRTTPPPPLPHHEQHLTAVAGDYAERVLVLDEILTAHRTREPHHELALIAVRHDRQHQRLGHALLDHHQRHLDHHQITAHTHACGPTTRNLLARNGFTAATGPVRLPNLTPIWPMTRTPVRHPSQTPTRPPVGQARP